MDNSKLPMCHHWTWSRKGGTRYFSQACRTSSRDITEDRPSETLDAAIPVDVPKNMGPASPSQLQLMAQDPRRNPPSPFLSIGSISSSSGTEGWGNRLSSVPVIPVVWSSHPSVIPLLQKNTPNNMHLLWLFQWSGMGVKVGLWRKLSAKELMLLNCGVGEDSWEFLGLQGNPTNPS